MMSERFLEITRSRIYKTDQNQNRVFVIGSIENFIEFLTQGEDNKKIWNDPVGHTNVLPLASRPPLSRTVSVSVPWRAASHHGRWNGYTRDGNGYTRTAKQRKIQLEPWVDDLLLETEMEYDVQFQLSDCRGLLARSPCSVNKGCNM